MLYSNVYNSTSSDWENWSCVKNQQFSSTHRADVSSKSNPQCVSNTQSCPAENFSVQGTQTWDTQTNAWGICQGFTCADGF